MLYLLCTLWYEFEFCGKSNVEWHWNRHCIKKKKKQQISGSNETLYIVGNK